MTNNEIGNDKASNKKNCSQLVILGITVPIVIFTVAMICVTLIPLLSDSWELEIADFRYVLDADGNERIQDTESEDTQSKGKLLFIDDGQIWQFDSATNRFDQITYGESPIRMVWNPLWSPDGQAYAYGRFGDLWLSDRNSEFHREIAFGVDEHSWVNPSTLSYCRHEKLDKICFLYDINSEATQALQEGDYWWSATYSPDASKVIVRKRKPNTEQLEFEDKVRLLDVETKQSLFEFKAPIWPGGPQWTSDGEKFAFTTSLSDYWEEGEEVFVIDASGENLLQLTHLAEMDETPTFATMLQWSPDDEWLAFVIYKIGTQYGNPVFWEPELAIIRADGTDFRRLNIWWASLGIHRRQSPVWSPDSKQIAYFSRDTEDRNKWNISIVDIETGNISEIIEVFNISNGWFDWR